MKYESMIIGHVTMDTNIDHLGETVHIAGGAVLYSSASAYALGHNVLAVTKVAPTDRDRLSQFTLPAENLVVVDGEKSTDILNQYFTADKERRSCRCVSQGTGFTMADVPQAESEIYHFAGLMVGDYEDGMIESLSKRGKVAVDVQGVLRNVADSGEMYFADWADKRKLLPYVHFLKTDAAEAEILTGTSDRKAAAKMLYDWGAKDVLITHNTEVLAYDGKEFYTCPIRSRNLSGRTGRGDTTFAAYITERLTKPTAEALLIATATVSLKMETPGVFRGSKADVMQYIDEFYSDLK